jgi:hypothetical protein
MKAKSFYFLRLTPAERRDVLELLDGVDRAGGIKCGRGASVRNYDNVAARLRRAKIRKVTR